MTNREDRLEDCAVEFDQVMEKARRANVPLFEDTLPARHIRKRLVEILQAANEVHEKG